MAASLTVFGFILYKGYYDGIGGFVVSLPFATLFGFIAKVAIFRMFPPRLQACADGSISLALNASDPAKTPGTPINSR